MEFGDLFAILRRRWIITIPMLVLTVLAIAGSWVMIHTQYESQVQLSMINAPKVSNEPGNDGNPFLAFDTTLAVDADFLARNVTSDQAGQQLAARGLKGTYTAELAANALGPFMQMSVTGTSKQDVSRSTQILVTFTEQRWMQLQQSSSVPNSSIIGMTEIEPPSTPTAVQKRKIEAVAGVAVGGLVLSVLVPVMTDSIIRRRRSRAVVKADDPRDSYEDIPRPKESRGIRERQPVNGLSYSSEPWSENGRRHGPAS